MTFFPRSCGGGLTLLALGCEIQQPNLLSSPGSLGQTGGFATPAAGPHWAPPAPSLRGVDDVKAASRVSATDLSRSLALPEMLRPPPTLYICRTQALQLSGTSLLIPGPLREEESLCDSVDQH